MKTKITPRIEKLGFENRQRELKYMYVKELNAGKESIKKKKKW